MVRLHARGKQGLYFSMVRAVDQNNNTYLSESFPIKSSQIKEKTVCTQLSGKVGQKTKLALRDRAPGPVF